MLIDTDVLIWMTRGHAGAAARLQALKPWRISAVTYIELAQGCRSKQELAQIKKGFARSNSVERIKKATRPGAGGVALKITRYRESRTAYV